MEKKTRRRRSRPGGPTSTLADVARLAGVSTATVSRYLNSPRLVGGTTGRQIAEAVAALGYIPHHAARALASHRSKIIGAIVPTLDNAIFSAQIMSFQRHIGQAGYTLLLAASEYDAEAEFKQAHALLERGIEALMLVGERRSPAFYELMARMNVPFVNTWLYRPDAPHPCCGFPHAAAQRLLVDHLTGLGHRRFGVITGHPETNDRVLARLRAIVCALQEAGVTLDPDYVVQTDYSFIAGRRALGRLMALDPAPTAVIAGNDVLASGALFAAADMGIGVPDRLSVVGFGNLPIAEQLAPPLTTLQTPKAEIGRAAADYLLARLAGETPPKHVELQVRLCLRGSTGPVGG